jgi:ABC-type Mn2+/Zn2+ transport system ATPase subunit
MRLPSRTALLLGNWTAGAFGLLILGMAADVGQAWFLASTLQSLSTGESPLVGFALFALCALVASVHQSALAAVAAHCRYRFLRSSAATLTRRMAALRPTSPPALSGELNEVSALLRSPDARHAQLWAVELLALRLSGATGVLLIAMWSIPVAALVVAVLLLAARPARPSADVSAGDTSRVDLARYVELCLDRDGQAIARLYRITRYLSGHLWRAERGVQRLLDRDGANSLRGAVRSSGWSATGVLLVIGGLIAEAALAQPTITSVTLALYGGARLSGFGSVGGLEAIVGQIAEIPGRLSRLVIPDPPAPSQATALAEADDSKLVLGFDHLWFRYSDSDDWAIRGVTIGIHAGEIVGVAGGNGAGKSTLLNLALGLLSPTRGTVTRQWAGTPWYLPQHVTRFPLGEAANANPHNLLSLVERLEATRHGIEGAPEEALRVPAMSGGEWQLVGLGRLSVNQEVGIALLDEPTAALSPLRERDFVADLMERRLGLDPRCAVLVSSHRLSTLRRCDRVLVLDDGLIAEAGTHDELITRGGIYRSMYDLQAAGFRDPWPERTSAP